MKKLNYIYVYEVNLGTVDEPNIVQNQQECETTCMDEDFESCYAYAKAHALNGEVAVEDVTEPVSEPTQFDIIEAQVTYTAMMTDTLLEG